MSNKTAMQQLVQQLNEHRTNCTKFRDLLFFDAVLAMIEANYLLIEKELQKGFVAIANISESNF